MRANLAGLRRRIVIALVTAVLAVFGVSTASAGADSSADLEVTLSSVASLLMPSAFYAVTITNHGPGALDSATVTVRLDLRAWSTLGSTVCPLDRTTSTLTCTFGAVPAGASASLKPHVYYNIKERFATLQATATRTASTPADPNATNDSDPTTCWYEFSVWGSTMRCAG